MIGARADAFPSQEPRRKDMNFKSSFFVIVPLVVIVGLIYAFAHPPWTAVRIAGLVIAVVSFALLTVARVQLGNAFSITPQAKKLVTSGIYLRIRNPVYVFSALGIAGLILFVEKPYYLLLFIIVIPLQIFRAGREARVLEERFGEEYRKYRAATWF
jgi:protein-S-isoprenylcysteine O-methyltransferase Ste14